MSGFASTNDDVVLCVLCGQYREPREFPVLKGNRLYERCKPCLRKFPVEYLFVRDNATCGICRLKVRDLREASRDHIVPVSAWDWNARPEGPHVEDNLQLAHLRCNLAKGSHVGDTAHA